MQAVQDYRKALRYLKKHAVDIGKTPQNKKEQKVCEQIIESKVTVYECEKFFKSGYFNTLTNLDGHMVMTRIKEKEVAA